MDYDLTYLELSRFHDDAQRVQEWVAEGGSGHRYASEHVTHATMRRDLTFVQDLLNELEPGLGDDASFDDTIAGRAWRDVIDAIERGMAIIEHHDRSAIPRERARPTLTTDELHPWIRESAAHLWRDGHLRAALRAATARLETEIQVKVDRYDIAGVELVTQAFSHDAPTPGHRRLRFVGDADLLDGARNFALGCLQGIRGVETHRRDEPAEQVAFEQLAALSLLARWIDDATAVDAGADEPARHAPDNGAR